LILTDEILRITFSTLVAYAATAPNGTNTEINQFVGFFVVYSKLLEKHNIFTPKNVVHKLLLHY
jgi:hypothetical protein